MFIYGIAFGIAVNGAALKVSGNRAEILHQSRSSVCVAIMNNNTLLSLIVWLKQMNQIQQTVTHCTLHAAERYFRSELDVCISFLLRAAATRVGCLIYFHHILGKHGQRGWWVWIFGDDSLCFITQRCLWDGFSSVSLFLSSCLSVSDAADLPADGLFLISDACLPECPVGLFQAESNGSLQVIFVVACQVNHIYTHTHTKTKTREHEYTFMLSTQSAVPTPTPMTFKGCLCDFTCYQGSYFENIQLQWENRTFDQTV